MMANMQFASYEREKRLYHFDGYIANLYDKQDVCDSTILKWRSYLVQSIDLIIMKQRTSTKLMSEFIDDDLANSKFFEFRNKESKISTIRELIYNMYTKIFKVGITLAFDKSVQSLNIEKMVYNKLAKKIDNIKQELEKYLNSISVGNRREIFNRNRIKMASIFIEEQLKADPLLKALYSNKMLTILERTHQIEIIMISYEAFCNLNQIKLLNGIEGINLLSAFTYEGERNPNINKVLLKHYIEVIDNKQHLITNELKQNSLGYTIKNFKEAFEYLKENFGKYMVQDNYKESYRQSIIVTEKNFYKLITAIELFTAFDFIYKSKLTIGEIVKDMMTTSTRIGNDNFSEDLVEQLKRLSKIKEIKRSTSRSIISYAIKIPQIESTAGVELTFSKLTTFTFEEADLAKIFDTRILLPSAIMSNKLIEEIVLNSDIKALLGEISRNWEEINALKSGQMLDEKRRKEITGKSKYNIFTEWINEFAGEGME